MTDKGTTDDIAQRYIAVVDERDDLRSEVITLEWQLSEATNEVERLRDQIKVCDANAHYEAWQASQAEVERQKAFIDSIMPELTMMRTEHARANAEVERLRGLEAIVREHIDHRELAYHLREWLVAYPT